MYQKFKSKIPLTTIICLLLLFHHSSFSQDYDFIGEMEDIINQVLKEDLQTRFMPQSKIIQNEKVITREKSLANAKFDDGSLISIGPDSSVIIDEWIYDPDKSLTNGAINLGKGFLRYASSKLGKNNVKLTSNAVTLSLRGTVLDLAKDRDQTALGVISGEVEVNTRLGTTIVPEGSFYFASASQPQGSILTSPPKFLLDKMIEASSVASMVGKEIIYPKVNYPKMPKGRILRLSTIHGAINFCLKKELSDNQLTLFPDLNDKRQYRIEPDKIIPNYALLFKSMSIETQAIDIEDSTFYFGSLGIIGAKNNNNKQLFVSLNRYKRLDGEYYEIGRADSGFEILYKIKEGGLSMNNLGEMNIGIQSDLCG